jgi:CheY-like chemotaxis protein
MSTTKKILVVEDEQALRDFYVMILQGEGYDVESVNDGNEAFAKMHTGGYDLVLLDIMIPEINGVEVLKKLSVDKPLIPNKVIVPLTNLVNDAMIKEMNSLGARGYLVKSDYTPYVFLIEVKKYLV